MKWLINILKSRTFLIGFGIVLIIVLILALARWFQWDTNTQLIAVIGVLVLAIVLLAVGFVRANRSAMAIERSIKEQARQQMMSARPDRRAEVEQLQKQLDAAIQTLKQSKLGRGRRGTSALYALPWYLFIGPPAAGKTTAIANSGLNFPIGTNRLRGVGGTRNCDWFFSDSAILLDTAGRYMTEVEDSDEWYTFLDTLKAHRRERPINGVIVGISIADLAGATPEEIEWHAENIRKRIDELIKRLGIRFPVYLLFTKCDLLQGFVEFFGDMSRKEREQIWGVTLDRDQQNSTQLRFIFEQEFQRMVDTLMNLRASYLSRSMKREDRQKVYVFPLEFASIKENLAYFAERLFQLNPYQESPIFRGFYFTSGTQEGIPLDRVIQSIAQQFDLPPEMSGGFSPEMETKSYFIKDVFTDVIIPDQYMVSQTSRAATRWRLAQAGVTVASIAVLGLFLLAATWSFMGSKRSLNRVLDTSQVVAAVRWTDPEEVEDAFRRLELMRQEMIALEDPPVRLGLNRNDVVRDPARHFYLTKLREYVEGYPYRVLQELLTRIDSQSVGEVTEKQSLFYDLMAYLLLTSETGKLQDESNRAFLRRRLSELTAETLQARSENQLSLDLEREILVQDSVFVEGLYRAEIAGFSPNDGLVTRVRSVIQDRPDQYNLIIRRALDDLGTVSIGDLLDGRNANLFDPSAEVPRIFTRDEGYQYFEQQLSQESELPNLDWVLGIETQADGSGLTMEEVEALRGQYFRDYVRAWQRFLGEVQYRPPQDLRDAVEFFTRLSDPQESPILFLLANVSYHTRFEPEDSAAASEGLTGGIQGARNAARRANPMGRSGQADSAYPVDAAFRWLHALNPMYAVSGGAPELSRALADLGEITGVLESISGGGAEAAEYARKVLMENGAELERAVRRMAEGLRMERSLVNRLFQQPVYMAWGHIIAETQTYYNRRWHEEVYEPFQRRLANRYPFRSGAEEEVALRDFEEFFTRETRDGIVAAFEEELSPFLLPGKRPRTWNDRGLRLSGLVDVLEDAERVREGLFEGERLGLSFRLFPEGRLEGSLPVERYIINVHGQSNSYDMGPARWTEEFRWPGQPDASIEVVRRGTRPGLSFRGDWAWFRLLEQANVIRQASNNEYEVRWTVEDQVVARYRLQSRNAAFPFDNARSFFQVQCPETID